MAILNLEVDITDRVLGTATPDEMINDELRMSNTRTGSYDLTSADNNIDLVYPSFEYQGFDMLDSSYEMPVWEYIVMSPTDSDFGPGHSHYIKWLDTDDGAMYILVPDDDPNFTGQTRYKHYDRTRLQNNQSIGVMSESAYRRDSLVSSTPGLSILLSAYRNHFNALTLYFNRYAFDGVLSFYNYNTSTRESYHLEDCDIPFVADENSNICLIENKDIIFNQIFNKIVITFNTPKRNNTMVGLKYIKFGNVLHIDHTDSSNAFESAIEVFGELSPLIDDIPLGTCSLSVRSSVKPYEDQQMYIRTDAYNGYYIIDSVTRQAKDIYSISGKDVMHALDNIDAPDSYGNETVNYFLEKIELKSGVTMPRLADADDFQITILPGIENCRKYLAAICFAAGIWITSFGSPDGPQIKRCRVLEPYTPELAMELDEHNVFYAPEYQNAEMVDGIKYTYDETEYTYDFPYGKSIEPNYKSVNDAKSKKIGETVPALLERNSQYINGALVKGDIIYNGEQLGDLVVIPTRYDGLITGYIQSINLKLSTVAIATVEVRSI